MNVSPVSPPDSEPAPGDLNLAMTASTLRAAGKYANLKISFTAAAENHRGPR
jgi:hypothetical protein